MAAFYIPPRKDTKAPSAVMANLPLIVGLTAGAVALLLVLLFLLAAVRRRKAQTGPLGPSEATPLSLQNGLKMKEPSIRSSSPDDSCSGSQAELREFFPLRRLSTPAMLARPRSPRSNTPEDFLKRRFSAIPEGVFPTEDLPKYSCLLKERFSIFGGDLDPSLYGSDEDLMLHTLNSYGAGKLCFSLVYNVKHKTLFVTIHKATYLSSRTAKESGNFYVKVSLVPGEAKPHRTTTVSTIRNPIFEQSFSFTLEPQDVETRRVQFTVKEATRMDKNITIGSVWFKLHEAQLAEHAETLQEVWRDIICVDKVSTDHGGDVELSLSYTPANGILVVGVLNGRNMAARDQDVSLYVRVSVMAGERAIKTKKTRSVKQNLRHPQFDQRMQFAVDNALMTNVYVQIHVCSRSRFGMSHLVGKCCLGAVNYAEGEGLSHWTAMLKEPGSTIHQWHRLT